MGSTIESKRRLNALVTLAPLVVTFLGLYALKGSAREAGVATIMLGFGPFVGWVADAFMGNLTPLIALGALDWAAIVLVVWKTRAGHGPWKLYAVAVCAWLVTGWIVLKSYGLDV